MSIRIGDFVWERDMQYYPVERQTDGTVRFRAPLVQKWIEDKQNIIVIDKSTIGLEKIKCMLLTPLELSIDGISENKLVSNYHDGEYTYIKYKWLTDNRIEIPAWHKAMLTRFHPEWFQLLRSTLESPSFEELNKVKQKAERKKHVVYPEREQVYRAFETPPGKIRVVIIGQDPYPNGEANGWAFAVNPETKVPPSLKLIREVFEKDDYTIGQFDTTLKEWVDQGVMLLNSSLSVRAGQPGSYKEDWHEFIAATIKALANLPKPVIFVFIGKQAQEFQMYARGSGAIFNVEHPAAAARAQRAWNHEGIFDKINEILVTTSKPIKWIEPLPF
jgi:uracil-DNA glycosylase